MTINDCFLVFTQFMVYFPLDNIFFITHKKDANLWGKIAVEEHWSPGNSVDTIAHLSF
jgi:hypothetical protein